jgi:hypothetical protein
LDHDSLSGSQSPDSDSSSSVPDNSYGSASNPILIDVPPHQFETSDWDIDSSSTSSSPPYNHEDPWSSDSSIVTPDSWDSPVSAPPSNPWAHPSHQTIPGSVGQQPGYFDPFFTGFADEVKGMWDHTAQCQATDLMNAFCRGSLDIQELGEKLSSLHLLYYWAKIAARIDDFADFTDTNEEEEFYVARAADARANARLYATLLGWI